MNLENKRPKPASVPKKYRNPATSGLAVTIEEGENTLFDFDLK